MKSLVSLSLVSSLALLVPALSGCGAGGSGPLFSELENSEPREPDFLSDDDRGPGGKGGKDGGSDIDDGVDSPNAGNPLATGISISRIDLFQAVGIGLMHNGAEVTKHNAPIVIGKDALIRVMVKPEAEWQAREVVGRLELHDGSGPVAAYESTLHVTAASVETNLATTLHFDVPGARITGDLAYTVSIRESSEHAQYPGTAAGAEWPGEGVAQIQTQDSLGNFKFKLIPYRYNGLLPDTSEKQLQLYREKFTGYPTPDVEITVHAPVDHSGAFDARGNGWETLLQKTCDLRRQERPAKNEFYFGIISPTANFGQFCGAGCVAGLAPLAQQAGDNNSRCGIGLGYTGQMAVETAMHELGHALGRAHAPCAPGGQRLDGVDRGFPYPQAGLGSWGWEKPTRKLHHPTSVKDMMSYCSPVWISDYTYKAIFDRISFVNASPLIKLPADFPERWRSIILELDGSLLWGGRNMSLDSVPSGTPKTIYLLDENGKQIGEATGFYYGNEHLPTGSILVPEDQLAGAKAIRIAGRPALAL